MPYTAAVFDESGADRGPLDVSAARDHAQARELASKAGMQWLVDNGEKRATVRISDAGYMLSVEVGS